MLCPPLRKLVHLLPATTTHKRLLLADIGVDNVLHTATIVLASTA